MSKIYFTVLQKFELLKKLHLPNEGKLRTKSTSSGLTDTTFFAPCLHGMIVVFGLWGSLRKDEGDGSENGKKGIGLD